jgi:hypothetical protein
MRSAVPTVRDDRCQVIGRALRPNLQNVRCRYGQWWRTPCGSGASPVPRYRQEGRARRPSCTMSFRIATAVPAQHRHPCPVTTTERGWHHRRQGGQCWLADGSQIRGCKPCGTFCIVVNRQAGRCGIAGAVVQEQLGHSSITTTFEVCGHLFPNPDDRAQLAAAQGLPLWGAAGDMTAA